MFKSLSLSKLSTQTEWVSNLQIWFHKSFICELQKHIELNPNFRKPARYIERERWHLKRISRVVTKGDIFRLFEVRSSIHPFDHVLEPTVPCCNLLCHRLPSFLFLFICFLFQGLELTSHRMLQAKLLELPRLVTIPSGSVAPQRFCWTWPSRCLDMLCWLPTSNSLFVDKLFVFHGFFYLSWSKDQPVQGGRICHLASHLLIYSPALGFLALLFWQPRDWYIIHIASLQKLQRVSHFNLWYGHI